jgi:hypothetical protein
MEDSEPKYEPSPNTDPTTDVDTSKPLSEDERRRLLEYLQGKSPGTTDITQHPSPKQKQKPRLVEQKTPEEIKKDNIKTAEGRVKDSLDKAAKPEDIKAAELKYKEALEENLEEGKIIPFDYDYICKLIDEICADNSLIGVITNAEKNNIRGALARVLKIPDEIVNPPAAKKEEISPFESQGKIVPRPIPFKNGTIISGIVRSTTGSAVVVEMADGSRVGYSRSDLLNDDYIYSNGEDADSKKLEALRRQTGVTSSEVQKSKTLQEILEARSKPTSDSTEKETSASAESSRQPFVERRIVVDDILEGNQAVEREIKIDPQVDETTVKPLEEILENAKSIDGIDNIDAILKKLAHIGSNRAIECLLKIASLTNDIKILNDILTYVSAPIRSSRGSDPDKSTSDRIYAEYESLFKRVKEQGII